MKVLLEGIVIHALKGLHIVKVLDERIGSGLLTQDIQPEVLWPPVIVSCTMPRDVGGPTMERTFTHDSLISKIYQDKIVEEEKSLRRKGGRCERVPALLKQKRECLKFGKSPTIVSPHWPATFDQPWLLSSNAVGFRAGASIPQHNNLSEAFPLSGLSISRVVGTCYC